MLVSPMVPIAAIHWEAEESSRTGARFCGFDCFGCTNNTCRLLFLRVRSTDNESLSASVLL